MRKLIHQPDLGLLIFRLFIGLSMAFAHGYSKIPPPDRLVEGVTAMGFPMPVLFAWCASLSEFAGGLLIAAGLFTRHAAAFLAFTMAVAAFKVHAPDPYSIKEMALLYLFSSILFIFLGAGKFSLDKMIRKK